MPIIQHLMFSICLFICEFFLVCSCILEYYRTCLLVLDKLPDEIRCNWHLILWPVMEEKLIRSLFMTFFLFLSLAFFLASSPAKATAQMQCADCGYVLALLLYVRTLPNRTALYGVAGTTHQNWFSVQDGHLRLLCKRFYNFCLSFFIANSRRRRMEFSPYVRLNGYGHRPVFAWSSHITRFLHLRFCRGLSESRLRQESAKWPGMNNND